MRQLRAQVIAQGGTRVFAARSIRSVENQQCVYCLSMFSVDPEHLLLLKKIRPSNMRCTSREILRSACICVTVSYSSTQELCSRSFAQLCCADLHGSLPELAESLVDGGHAVRLGKLCECSLLSMLRTVVLAVTLYNCWQMHAGLVTHRRVGGSPGL